MRTATLSLTYSSAEGSFSHLRAEDGADICRMVELPWRDNEPNMSCIPSGIYHVEYIESSASGRYKDCYLVREVPGRSGILIHKGNFAGDTRQGYKSDSNGCLLPARRFGVLDNGKRKQRCGIDSAGGMSKLHSFTGRKDFYLVVQRAGDNYE